MKTNSEMVDTNSNIPSIILNVSEPKSLQTFNFEKN